MTIHILGLGETLSKWTNDGNITIGVNDIYTRFKTDYVVCVDHPHAFNSERLKGIKQTKCKGFYSQITEWNTLQNFTLIEFNKGRGLIDGIDSERFCYSNTSTYVATILAYKLGAKSIILWGVDLNTHPHIKDNSRERALKDFKVLNSALKNRGVKLFVGSSESSLSKFLDVY